MSRPVPARRRQHISERSARAREQGRRCMMKAPSLTIGIEEEYQIIDPQTRELRSYITEILEEGKLILLEQVKPELHQAMVEVGSNVCQTPAELRNEMVRLRRTIMELAAKNGLKIVSAGTHPFSSWMTRRLHRRSATWA